MSRDSLMRQIAEYFKTQPVLKAWLFGSFARGEETQNSDVDILVEFDRTSPIGLLAYIRMHRELEERLGRKVDLVEEGTLRPAAQMTANRDLKVIYERSN
ncbi:MAG: nucleotidyltransferase family protein [Prevotella sp.]|nr:nucleotidyltransferase family protein [Prevotella sp.]